MVRKMSKKKGFSMFDRMMPRVRLCPLASDRAWRLGWYLSSRAARMTRARVEFLTRVALFKTRETVAEETPAFFATCARVIGQIPSVSATSPSILAARGRPGQRGGIERKSVLQRTSRTESAYRKSLTLGPQRDRNILPKGCRGGLTERIRIVVLSTCAHGLSA